MLYTEVPEVLPSPHLLLVSRFWDRGIGVFRPFGTTRMTEGASSTSQSIAGALVIIRSARFAHSSNKKNTSKMPVCHKELFCSWRDPCKCGCKCIFMPGSIAGAGPGCEHFASFMFFPSLHCVSLAGLGAALPCCGAAEGQPWPQPRRRDGVRGERARAGTCWLLELVGRRCLVLGVMESGRRLESATVNTSN